MAVVQVQKGTPVSVLIGTNLPQVCALFLQRTAGVVAMNLLDERCGKCQSLV